MSERLKFRRADGFVDPADDPLLKTIFRDKDGDIVIIHGRCEYTITANRCRTPTQVLDWIHHLADKTWMTPEMIGRLIEVTIPRVIGSA